MKKEKECREFCEVIINTLGGELIPFNGDIIKDNSILWKHGGGLISLMKIITLKKDKEGKVVEPEIVWLSYTEADGSEGWLKGRAEYLVFEGIDDWLIISRAKLLRLANSKLTTNLKAESPNEAWYRLYSPPHGKSVSMKINKSLIRHYADKIIIKKCFVDSLQKTC